jgi:hypothetical protein
MNTAVCIGCGLLLASPVIVLCGWLLLMYVSGVIVGESIVACSRLGRVCLRRG